MRVREEIIFAEIGTRVIREKESVGEQWSNFKFTKTKWRKKGQPRSCLAKSSLFLAGVRWGRQTEGTKTEEVAFVLIRGE